MLVRLCLRDGKPNALEVTAAPRLGSAVFQVEDFRRTKTSFMNCIELVMPKHRRSHRGLSLSAPLRGPVAAPYPC